METAFQYFQSDIRKKVRRLSILEKANTRSIEPIEENREKHLTIMMPMIMNIARSTIQKYTKRVELEDAIQAGVIGCITAIDIYYEKAKTSEHSAKLSTFAYHYIRKYINEYCWKSNTILSAETTKWTSACSKQVKSGDESVNSEDDTKVFDRVLCSSSQYPAEDEKLEFEVLKSKLFSCISDLERKVVFMKNGIGCDEPMGYREISIALNYSIGKIHATEHAAMSKLKKLVEENSELAALLTILHNNRALANWKI